jgi:hypothetical protein
MLIVVCVTAVFTFGAGDAQTLISGAAKGLTAYDRAAYRPRILPVTAKR